MRIEIFFLIISLSSVVISTAGLIVAVAVFKKSSPRFFRRRRRGDYTEQQLRDLFMQTTELRELIQELHDKVFSSSINHDAEKLLQERKELERRLKSVGALIHDIGLAAVKSDKIPNDIIELLHRIRRELMQILVVE